MSNKIYSIAEPQDEEISRGWFEELTLISDWWGSGWLKIDAWFDPDLVAAPVITGGATTYQGYYMPQGWF